MVGRVPTRSIAVGVVLFGIAVVPACSDRAAATIHDAAFVRQANALCKAQLPPLRAKKKDSDVFGNTPKNDRQATAAKVEAVAGALDKVAAELGALPLRAQDQGEVAGWLEEWANFTGIGREYAAAVRTEKASVYTRIAAGANGPVGRIARFARANHIDECVL
jgi:hypothetical protein